MPRLIVRSTPYRGDATVELTRLRTTLGRSAINDLCVEDPFASRLHAEIRRREDGFRIFDVGSANGTTINGLKIKSSSMLMDGDRIRIGETEIEYSERPSTTPTLKGTTILYLDSPQPKEWEMTIPPSSRNSAANLLSVLEESQATVVRPKQNDLLPENTLSVISELSLKLLSPLSLEETLKQVLEFIFKYAPADRGYVMLLDNESGKKDAPLELVCKAMKLSSAGGGSSLTSQESVSLDADTNSGIDSGQLEVGISRSITDQVINHGTAILTSDAQLDPRFNEKQSVLLNGLRSVIAVPVLIEKRILGMIYIDRLYQDHKFSERDFKLVTLIAGVAAIRIENTRLLDLQIEQKRLANELSTASEIQLRLIPEKAPTLPGYELLGYSFPCYEVGGDYYDFIDKRDGKFAIALGDVSGKGTAAALLMSSLHAAVRAHAGTGLCAKSTIDEINKYLYDNTPDNRYVTLFYSEIDVETNQLTYLNAGHMAPLLIKPSGEVKTLEKGGFPLGVLIDSEYEQDSIELESGDVLVIYSDGVTESQNEEGDEFGDSKLIEAALKSREQSASKIRDRIDEALTKFTGKARSVDDLTLVILKKS